MDCYILMGVIHKQSNNFEASLEAYLKAKQICEGFSISNNMGIVLHNIGSLYSMIGNSEQAVSYYKQGMKNRNEISREGLLSIYCIAIEYSKMNERLRVIEWCERGISIYETLDDENQASFYHQFAFLKSMHSEQGLSESIAKNTIAFFKGIQEYQSVSKFCIALGNWYFENKKYKLSAILYQDAHKYGNIYKNINEWEDL